MSALPRVLLLVLFAAACAAPAPQAGREAPRAAPAAGGPAASSPGLAPADWQRQWDDLVAAARREGKVVVYGPAAREAREWLPKAFKDRFGVEMEYIGEASGTFSAKLATERAIGIYSADAVISGANSMYEVIAGGGKVDDGAMGMLAPLRPALLDPEVLDPSRYLNGKLWLMDPEQQYVWRLSAFISPAISVNPEHVRPSEIKTWHDLLKPEYRGKIAGFDPTIAGAAIAHASYLYTTLGRDYVRQLFVDQQPFISRDHRQLADQLGRGTRPIVLNLRNEELVRIREEGLPAEVVPTPPEPPDMLSGGGGYLGLIDKAPHPNAARLVVNWLAGPEGALLYAKARQEVSTRQDVDRSAFAPYTIPKSGTELFDSHAWEFVTVTQPQVEKELRDLLGRN
jgi:ABC-type Fe3+ transport system substrate-binding protein